MNKGKLKDHILQTIALGNTRICPKILPGHTLKRTASNTWTGAGRAKPAAKATYHHQVHQEASRLSATPECHLEAPSLTCERQMPFNVRGEPIFSVMAAGWFCEKESGGC